ncbi:hypothetical protein BDM02DRAFT_249813 [Thelephora ganbajun]|uniref:Uncharacterized protein n=1 Tax=Thelephora ganbajun TaxID=370292 RepID=A0ACB6YXG4_THEGA|nr:hypothetical protein BDM02DRAFT_249813 [Thelephora ganbajun]
MDNLDSLFKAVVGNQKRLLCPIAVRGELAGTEALCKRSTRTALFACFPGITSTDLRHIRLLYAHDHSGGHPSSPDLPPPLSLVITGVASTPSGRSSVIAEAAGT